MQLHDVTTTACPVCGCTDIVSESIETSNIGVLGPQIHRHVNGGRWESRTFLCGYTTKYIPNFTRENKERDCRHNPEILERNARRKEAHDKVVSFIGTLDIDAAYRQTLEYEIQSTSWHFR